MRTLLVLLLHLVISIAKLIEPGRAKALIAEMLLAKRSTHLFGKSTVTDCFNSRSPFHQ